MAASKSPMLYAMQNKVTILSTRPLPESLIKKAMEKNIGIDTISFIETESIGDDLLKKNILHLSHHQLTIVFTSMNAVESVIAQLENNKPDWKIFCMGNTTKNIIRKYFGETSIAGTADSASALADVIIQQKNINTVVFFCGNQRRDELPDKLKQHQIEVNEIEVYRTIETANKIAHDYNGILFYSPSAVHSFFSSNKLNSETILFAIGNTTSEAIKKYANNKIVIAEEPSKEMLAEQALFYFETNPIHH
jgi:uroporphyrinogen-III synthase